MKMSKHQAEYQYSLYVHNFAPELGDTFKTDIAGKEVPVDFMDWVKWRNIELTDKFRVTIVVECQAKNEVEAAIEAAKIIYDSAKPNKPDERIVQVKAEAI